MDHIAGARPSAGIEIRWLGAGIAELWTAAGDLLFVDAWLWNNAGWEAFGAQRPASLASPEAFADSVRDRGAEAVAFLVTHDHRDHFQDLFGALTALAAAGVGARVVMQSDLARAGLVDAFTDAGLDPAALIVTGGAGLNIGGRTRIGSATVTTVPAVHSTLAGYPAVGYVVEAAGTSVYCSGDTDVFGDMALIAQRYRPEVAVLCVGGGPFTMDPSGAALATELLGCTEAIPVHYAHNPNVLGTEAGEQFARAVTARGLNVRVHVLRPGDTVAF